MKKTTFRNTLWKAKRIAAGVSMLFAFSAGTLFASDTSGMPDWQTPTAQGSFDSDGAGKISFAFSDSGGTKTGPGGSAVYTFSVPKGNFISISVSADDFADVRVPAASVSASSQWDATQKRIIPGEAKSAFVDIEEISSETFPVTIDYSNAGGPYVLSFTVFVERVKAEIETVNISATSKLTLSQDDGTAFDGSDWEKGRSRNGETREANPISVTSGNALKFVPTFRIKAETPPSKVRAEFVVPGATVPAQIKSYSSISSGFEIPAPVASGQINYFDNTLRITWSVQYDGCEKWFPAGTSSHEIYFTRAAPQTNLRQETLFWVACSGTVSGKTTDEEITNAIWSKFSTGAAPANLCRRDGMPLKYWGADEQTPAGNVAVLLSGGDGRCEAWATFFENALGVQGIYSSSTMLFPINEERDGFLIDNYEFSNVVATGLPDGFTHRVDYTVEGTVADGFVKDRVGIAGQNNSNPYSVFKNHQLLLVNGLFLDPSYGTVPNILQNVNCSIAGAVRDEPFGGWNIAKETRSFSYVIGTQTSFAQNAPRTGDGISCSNKKVGNATILWEYRNVFAENTLYLYQAGEENGNEENFDANRHLKRISLPLKSNILLRASGHRVVRETDTGVLVSAVVHGFEMFWEYNPKEERWTEYPSGKIFEEPSRGNVSAALWFLHALKRNGCLEGVSPKDYPVVFGISSEEVKKGMSAKDLFEALRARERILREAVLVEFSEDLSSTETPK